MNRTKESLISHQFIIDDKRSAFFETRSFMYFKYSYYKNRYHVVVYSTITLVDNCIMNIRFV